MKAGIYDPYLDTIGGGERYCLTLAEWLVSKGWEVEVFWNDEALKEKLCEKLNLDLKRVKFLPDKVFSQNNLLKKWRRGRKYSLLFIVSDGSVPLMFGKKNILHFQVPFQNMGGKSFWNRIKLKKNHNIVCNSFFTKKFIDKEFEVESVVIYPPVPVEDFKPLKKENIILSVSRFSQLMQAKRQDVLISGFKQMIKTDKNGYLKGWRLILAGGTEVGGEKFVGKLKTMAKNYPIEIITNPTFKDLQSLYGKAKIFWSAAGFGFSEEKNPEKMEHFGITTVEAMAAGCVPVVIRKGGQKEIVEDRVNGFLWRSRNELTNLTLQLIKQENLRKKMAVSAKGGPRSAGQSIKGIRKFSKEVFCEKFEELIIKPERVSLSG